MNSAELQHLQAMVGDNTTLLAVSKTVASSRLREVYHSGVSNFGENRFQELKVKQTELQDLDINGILLVNYNPTKPQNLWVKLS